jgi:hypothetical protein
VQEGEYPAPTSNPLQAAGLPIIVKTVRLPAAVYGVMFHTATVVLGILGRSQ